VAGGAAAGAATVDGAVNAGGVAAGADSVAGGGAGCEQATATPHASVTTANVLFNMC